MVQCSLYKIVRSREIAETIRFYGARPFNSGSSSPFGHYKTILMLGHSLQVLNISIGHVFSRPFGQCSTDRSMLGHPVQAYNRSFGQSFQDRSVFIPLEDRSVKALADRSVIFNRSFLNFYLHPIKKPKTLSFCGP
ncbi:hypothetical protein LR48_Vigan11g045000 [Vigna angularis]|uniref:Uncharacterized protein n=1 Tax=Phaseolus angularis TaxID=3914 RepID=A0A0L9VRB8_PHAAN|nr:hypothetical protein LR48_Vigan11g045000 [Vigna angularis]